MKILKRVALAVIILLSLPFIAALFMPRIFVIEREITIKKPKPEVFDYVKHLKNQEKYSKWALIDPKIKTSYRGTDGTVGFVMAWESHNQDVGKGEQEIKKVVEGDRIDVEIRIHEPFQSVDPAYTTTEAVGDNQTKVKSVYTGQMPYPMNLLCSYVQGKIGEDMATGLVTLKSLLEKP